MTAAYRLKGIGWFAGCAAVVLGFYLVSLKVANERKALDTLNARIVVAERDIRALETEFDTRANLAQLEKWNGDTLALSAPVAQQFVTDETSLAAIDVSRPFGEAEMRTAQMVVPAGIPSLAPAQAAMTLVAANAPVTVSTPARTASIVRTATAAVVDRASDRSVVRTTVAMVKARPQVAMLERNLLSESTIGDILANARAEAKTR
jgi:hypothetical protein